MPPEQARDRKADNIGQETSTGANGCSFFCRDAAAVCRKTVERAKGIEPSYAAWEAAVLPLNYARERRQPTTFRRRVQILHRQLRRTRISLGLNSRLLRCDLLHGSFTLGGPE